MEDARRPESARDRPESRAVPTLARASLWAQRALAEAQVDSPRLDAELLLAHTLGWRRSHLYTRSEQVLQCDQWLRYEGLVRRRTGHEPLAYLLGYREFYGLAFFVDHRVLIPRPETEILVEQAIRQGTQLLGNAGHLTVADVGTGCGVIAIALALSLPAAEVYAIDLLAPALEVAARNCRPHGVAGRVHLLQGDLLSPLPARVDLIVANLPYVARNEAGALSPEIRSYEPRQAWDGGTGGTEVIERLLTQAGRYLNSGGSILLEIGPAQGPAVRGLAGRYLPGAKVEILPDGVGRDRVISVTQVHGGTKAEGGRDLV
jgi:release factor glutamine methyltransferase